ncbi:TetR/AcrR family transcriptional regulator [Nonomuraea cavernae]|uniref:TetR family transcriptional regulator n=1 Tax=Nonomuraea cavernae TaxID=2045107 RepID=A0A918DHW6_9ACTN|nr:TetR family transcriptional regulator [Nonomuraea cavernae]MCA2185328.1 TetR family transcriptional regulator [Nonomuraea cavernae]GGO66128.1 TetR family transcriptional regulator [Nonomuraea cavernae]
MTTSAEQAARPEPPISRRRGEALRRVIFDAVIEQLGTVGYAKLSTNRVAAAAGTGKAALYRRWRNKEELVRDALRDLLPAPPEIPADTPLRDGLVIFLGYLNQALFDSKGTAFQAVAAAGDEQTAQLRVLFHESVTVPCETRIIELIRRYGGAASGASETAIAAAGPAMLLYHCISGQPKSTGEQIEAVVDDLLLPLIGSGG